MALVGGGGAVVGNELILWWGSIHNFMSPA